jgi:cytochrome oxidase Cu insertion factor (SCO1/SenC/PrrC family)
MLGSQVLGVLRHAQAGGQQMSSPPPGQATDGQPSVGDPGPAEPGSAESSGGQPAARRGGLVRLALLCGLATVLLGAIVAVPAYLIARHHQAQAPAQLGRVSGLPSTVSTSLANLMALSPLSKTAAPGFTLTDQDGHTLSLDSLRGKAVVLQFMDPHCTDICPIVSQEYVRAFHDLGPLASKVVFAAVNVNLYHARVADMAKYSRAEGLTTIPDWHFFTGPTKDLKNVWSGYNIDVRAPNPDADVVHTSAVYFIDPSGRERYIATPEVDHNKSGDAFLPASEIAAWGHGIALVARQLVH